MSNFLCFFEKIDFLPNISNCKDLKLPSHYIYTRYLSPHTTMKKFAWSLKYCINGLWFAFRYERNLKIQAWISIVATIIAGFVGFTLREWIVYIFAVILMFGMEIMNSAVEKLADEVTLKHKREIGVIKDLAAAASGMVSLWVAVIRCIFIFVS